AVLAGEPSLPLEDPRKGGVAHKLRDDLERVHQRRRGYVGERQTLPHQEGPSSQPALEIGEQHAQPRRAIAQLALENAELATQPRLEEPQERAVQPALRSPPEEE